MIEKVVHIKKLNSKQSDFEYWQSRPFEDRLLALEEIRQEYNSWKYVDQQRFQRVYHIIKKKSLISKI